MTTNGLENAETVADRVHTIDVWYSQRRQAWIIERLDEDGHHVGLSHACPTKQDAEACLREWLRSHGDTQHVEAEMPARRNRFRRAA